MKIRIKFAKYGSVKFIGHLDVMRFFQKAVRRAEIDVKYSEGFHPHQIMSFAAPLGVGIESIGEYMDLELNSVTDVAEIKKALNRTMVEGIEILSVRALPEGSKNAMASVAAASYQIHLKEGDWGENLQDRESVLDQSLREQATAFYAQKTIPCTKETKKGITELDLKQGIYEFYASGADVEISTMSAAAAMLMKKNEVKKGIFCSVPCVRMTVNASSSGNIKPSFVFEKFCEFAGRQIPLSACQITRLETYTASTDSGKNCSLVPLCDI